MVDPKDEDAKPIKDQSTCAKEYLEYTKTEEKGKVYQFDMGSKKDKHKQWYECYKTGCTQGRCKETNNKIELHLLPQFMFTS